MTAALCARPNCTRKTRCRGLCANHYQQAYKHIGYVDAGDTVKHIEALQDAGIGGRQLAKLSGISYKVIREVHKHKLLYANTEFRILAVPIPTSPADPNIAPSSNVNSIGSVRRLQALVALGYSQIELANLLGWCDTNVRRITRGKRTQVCAQTARIISDLFNNLQMIPGNNAFAKQFAKKHHWAPPFAWDEGDIDDPQAKPALFKNKNYRPCREEAKQRTRRLAEEFTEIVNDHRELGRSDKDIAERLGLTIDAFHLRLRRAGLKRKTAA